LIFSPVQNEDTGRFDSEFAGELGRLDKEPPLDMQQGEEDKDRSNDTASDSQNFDSMSRFWSQGGHVYDAPVPTWLMQ
jgi:hypothetical protein